MQEGMDSFIPSAVLRTKEVGFMSGLINQFHDRIDAWGEKLREKEIRIPINLVAGIVFLVFAITIIAIMPQQVAVSDRDVVNGRAFPSLLMYVMMLCSGMLVVKDLYKIVKKQPLEWKVINLQTEVKALVIFGILLVTFLLSKFTGMFIIGALFCSLAFLLYFRCSKKSYYVITLVLTVVIWAAFKFVLNVDF